MESGHSKAERYFRNHLLRPAATYESDGVKLLIGEGGPYYDRPSEYPEGYYCAAFFVMKGEKCMGFMPMEFSGVHDAAVMTDAARRAGRVNAAAQAGMRFVESARETGML